MKPFRFCPACATKVAGGTPDEGFRCSECGRVWYQNMAPTAGCVILRDGRALVTVRALEPEKCKIDVPGGFLRNGETPVEGVKREVKEELNLDVEVDPRRDFLQAVPHIYGQGGDWVLSLGFRARAELGDPVPADDVADFMWVTEAELDDLDFAWEHDRDLVRKALADPEEDSRTG